MPKAYWIASYLSIKDPDALAAYSKLGLPVIEAAGGRVLARGMPAEAYEHGLNQRIAVIEFDSVELARDTYNSPAYQEALKHLGDLVERDVRIIEATE